MPTQAKRKPHEAEITTKKQEQRKQRSTDSELDAALEETFPASDPVALTQRVTLKRNSDAE